MRKAVRVVLFFAPFLFYSIVQALSPKEGITLLFQQISESTTPYKDKKIANDITRLFKLSCTEKATQVLESKNLADKELKQLQLEMTKLCGCVASDRGFRKGVIASALLLKKQGEQAKSANIMSRAMIVARKRCKRHK